MDKERRAFYDARNRCTNPNHPRFADWGGRGIEFRFNSFEAFYHILGPCPEECSLDRFDNEGHYEVYNVRWATRSQQQHNKRVSSRNSLGISGVRQVRATGVVSNIWQAYGYKDKKFNQLYCGQDFFEACCARKSFDSTL